MLRRRLGPLAQRLRNPEGFVGPVVTLISGAAVAHGITGAALIALARIYSPADFGVLGLFSSILYTVSVGVCLRLDLAIILPDDDNEAFRLFCLALLGTAGFVAVSAIAVIVLPTHRFTNAAFVHLAPFLGWLPVSLAAVGVYSALQNWFIRERAYGMLARSRITQSAGAAATQVGLGLVSPSPLGLIVGFIMNSGAAMLVLLGPFMRSIRGRIQRPDWQGLKATFHKYRDFPRYSTWEALANSASIQMPILLIGALTNAPEVGQLTLAMTVVQAPMALFGNATAQVFMSQAPAKMREGHLGEFTTSTLRGLGRTGTPILLLLGIAAPFVFPALFGKEWSRAGILVAWMTPWLLLQFLASPVSSVLNITGHLRLASTWQITGLLFRLGAVWLGDYLFDGATEAFAVSGVFFYAAYLCIVLRIARTATVDEPRRT
jgi:O-antigen/teichoic acid export membrane protein